MTLERLKFLRVLGADPVRWADRYGLLPFDAACDGCGSSVTTSVPFACGTLRGLLAPHCDCGNAFPPYCVVRDERYGDLFTGSRDE